MGKEIETLKQLGVKIETNMVIGKVLSVDELFEQGFKAVFIGSGAGLPSFPGENLKGVYFANEFLTRVNLMKAYLPYRRSLEELPARKEEVEHAEEEGIIFKLLNNPTEILSDENDFVRAIKCIQMKLGEPDASGRRRPVEIDGSKYEIPIDCVIMS